MGGPGSGMGIRWNRRRTKKFVEQFKAIDARIFPYRHMKNLSECGLQFFLYDLEMWVYKNRLKIHHKKNSQRMGYYIDFSLSIANYGNHRYWFLCPNAHCNRRCRKLFLAEGSEGIPYFLCKVCLNLVHKSQNRIELDRIIDKKWQLIHSLGCDTAWILNSEKPKGMHWKTFNNIREEIDQLDSEATCRIAAMCTKA